MTTRVNGSSPAGGASAAPSTTTLAADFDKAFPYSNSAGNLTKLPGAISGASLPGEAGKVFANVQKANNYSNLKAYAVNVDGQKLYAVAGSNNSPPSDFGLALFNHNGKQLAFKDVLGLNQWQQSGKGNNYALAAGLPGFPKQKPVPPLSASTQKITQAFDKAIPWDDKSYSLKFPKGAEFNGALPAGSDAAKMSKNSKQDYDYTQSYKVILGGKSYTAVVGVADATYDVGLFDAAGKELAFNPGANAGQWSK